VCNPPTSVGGSNRDKQQLKCRADGASRRVCFKEIQSASLESGFGVYNPPTSVGGSKNRTVGGTNWNKQNVEPMAQAVGLVLEKFSQRAWKGEWCE
jgi:hypothetical protein